MKNLLQYLFISLAFAFSQLAYAQNDNCADIGTGEACKLFGATNSRICQKCLNGGQHFFSPTALQYTQNILEQIQMPTTSEKEEVWIVPARFFFRVDEYGTIINEDKVAELIGKSYPISLPEVTVSDNLVKAQRELEAQIKRLKESILIDFINRAIAQISPNTQKRVVILFITETKYAYSSRDENNKPQAHLNQFKQLFLVGKNINNATQSHYSQYFDLRGTQETFEFANTLPEYDTWLKNCVGNLAKVAERNAVYLTNLAGLSKREGEYAQKLLNNTSIAGYEEFEEGGFLYNPNRKYNNRNAQGGLVCVPNHFPSSTTDCPNISNELWVNQFYFRLGNNPQERHIMLGNILRGCIANSLYLELFLSCQEGKYEAREKLTTARKALMTLSRSIEWYRESLQIVGGEPTLSDFAKVLKDAGNPKGWFGGVILHLQIGFSYEAESLARSACGKILEFQKIYQEVNGNLPPNNIEANGACLDKVVSSAYYVTILSMPDAVAGAGHAAFLLGNDTKGWHFYSKEWRDAYKAKGVEYASMTAFKADNLQKLKYKRGYQIQIPKQLTPQEFQTIKAKALAIVDSEYDIRNKNCIDACSDILHYLGLDPGCVTPASPPSATCKKHWFPNCRYQIIKHNNQTHGGVEYTFLEGSDPVYVSCQGGGESSSFEPCSDGLGGTWSVEKKGAEWQLWWATETAILKFAWGTVETQNNIKTFTLNLDHTRKTAFAQESDYIAWGSRGLKCLFGEGAVALPADGKIKVVLSANSNTIDYTTYNLSTGSKEEKAVKTAIAQILAMLQMKVANVAENGSQVTIDFEKGANGNLTVGDITRYSVARFTYHNIAVKGIDFFKTRIGEEDAVLDLAIHGEGNQFRVYLEQANGTLETKLLTAGELAKVLNELPKEPATIRLLSCSDLASAEILARKLKRPVIATAGKVDIYEYGGIFSSTFHWYLLKPEGGQIRLLKNNSLRPKPPTQYAFDSERFVSLGVVDMDDLSLWEAFVQLRKKGVHEDILDNIDNELFVQEVDAFYLDVINNIVDVEDLKVVEKGMQIIREWSSKWRFAKGVYKYHLPYNKPISFELYPNDRLTNEAKQIISEFSSMPYALYRADTRYPNEVLNGFKSYGTEWDLYKHTNLFSKKSGYVSTTKQHPFSNENDNVLREFIQTYSQGGFIYLIKNDGRGYDVNDIYNNSFFYVKYSDRNKYAWNQEVAFYLHIKPENIMGAIYINTMQNIIGDVIPSSKFSTFNFSEYAKNGFKLK